MSRIRLLIPRAPRILAGVRAAPVRAAGLSVLALVLVWLAAAGSLAAYLAPFAPDWALRINPHQPVALLAKADRLRDRLLAAIKQDVTDDRAPSGGDGTTSQTAAGETARGPSPPVINHVERDRLRAEIRALAERVIAHHPLNAQAYRMLGEIETDVDRARVFMQAAAKRSRRETIAYFWLLNDSYRGGRPDEAAAHADVLLRTRPRLARYTMSYVVGLLGAEKGLAAVVERLAGNPPWRERFFDMLPRLARDQQAPLAVMVALRGAGDGPRPREIKAYLDHLMAQGNASLAYYAWLQFLGDGQLAALGYVYNPGFERKPSGAPFDWRLARGQGAIAEIVERPDKRDDRALHIRFFGGGRVHFPRIAQTITLAPGNYRLSGIVRGEVAANRGLRWRVSCLFGAAGHTAGETEMLHGKFAKWQTFEAKIRVPEEPRCETQQLALVHDARSASEQLISGEVWFDDIAIRRVDG